MGSWWSNLGRLEVNRSFFDPSFLGHQHDLYPINPETDDAQPLQVRESVAARSLQSSAADVIRLCHAQQVG